MIRATGYLIWRLCRIICGFLLLAAGLFLSLPGVPGPGFVLILFSFGILSRDFHWAKRAQDYVHRKWHELRNRKEQSPPPEPTLSIKKDGPIRRFPMDEKDRLGNKLRAREKADEDRYVAQRDKELLEKLKQQQTAGQEATLQQQALMHCPKCGTGLVTTQHHDVTVEECPACQGMWLDRGELETLAQREHEGWISRFLRRGLLRQE